MPGWQRLLLNESARGLHATEAEVWQLGVGSGPAVRRSRLRKRQFVRRYVAQREVWTSGAMKRPEDTARHGPGLQL